MSASPVGAFPGGGVLSWARRALPEDVVVSMIEPAAADALFSWRRVSSDGDERARERVARSNRVEMLGVVLRVILYVVVRRGVEARWLALVPISALAAVGVALVERASPGAGVSDLHLASTLLAITAAALVALWPLRAASRGWIPAALVIAALSAVPLFGVGHHTLRWINIGPLYLYVAVLLTPLVVVASARAFAHSERRGLALTMLLLSFVALQPAPAVVTVWLAIALSQARRRKRTFLVASPLLAFAWWTSPYLISLTQLERVVAGTHPGLVAAVVLMFAAMAAWAVAVARRARPGYARRIAGAAAAALCAMPIASVLADDGVPLVAFGGSASLSLCVCVGLLLPRQAELASG